MTVSIGRNDIGHAMAPNGAMTDSMRVPFNPSFKLRGEIVFQRVGTSGAMLNGDFIFLADEINPASNISMQPLDAGLAAAPDFAMKSNVIRPVITTMRGHSWAAHCLYNQETAKSPQLYFAHMMKTGDPIALAREIRDGLDRTATKRA